MKIIERKTSNTSDDQMPSSRFFSRLMKTQKAFREEIKDVNTVNDDVGVIDKSKLDPPVNVIDTCPISL